MLTLLEMRHSPYCIPIVRMLEACSVPFTRREIPNWDRREIGTLTGGNYYQVPVFVGVLDWFERLSVWKAPA